MQLQLFYTQFCSKAEEAKKIKRILKEALHGSQAYQQAMTTYNQAKAKKKEVETAILSDYSGEIDKLDEAKDEIKDKQESMTAEALQLIAKGEMPKVQDEDGNEYEAIFSVRFKKL